MVRVAEVIAATVGVDEVGPECRGDLRADADAGKPARADIVKRSRGVI